ncbi:hypothetical protein O4J56_15795 [Nocardiopsis sp. RSe5-2]|uniref:DUF1963 domain-containing protein n=1 Tax=Nocardiopsis endophytica TaxID=3018445 RepID=A0ABT4U586_9ACTN|nr:DUF1963 domain-containing protein [Nocardiopsis endophytica]MDA2812107.1 hypothetical protein [Nocardiopsis endophytica]
MDKQSLHFKESDVPVREPVTKLGGQPVWLEEPAWPLSAETGNPMKFIGQVRLPGARVRLAYLFMTDEEDFVDGTWEPEAGENAFFAQPGRPAAFYEVAPMETGPTHGPDHIAVTSAPDKDDKAHTFLGGDPAWLQRDEEPEAPGTWEHVLQLDSCDAPFDVNFGDAGIGYAFLNPETGEGRFLWQCA